MKKIISYILIIIALFGLFSSTGIIKAQEIKTCYKIPTFSPSSPGESTYQETTEEQCKDLGASWGIAEPSIADTPGLNCARLRRTWDPLTRTCVANSPPVDTTELNCNLFGGTWDPATKTCVDAVLSSKTPPSADTNTTYTPLAPLPGFMKEDGTAIPFNTADKCAFGKYMNAMINLIIGLIAVGAVVMIVLGGMQYMTSELISSKEAGKDKIRNALLGLLIALGSYALLYTINPTLLNMCFTLEKVNITIMEEGETIADAVMSEGGIPTSTPTVVCPTGIQRTASGMFACGNIAQNLDSMINAAKNAGLNITGGGYRTPEQQRQLRIKNCNGNETDRNAQCRPPTAIPGASRHNNGLAFDLKCNGVLIQALDNECFKWLQINAGRFDLSNLPGEPWHWSIDGR